MTLRTICFSIMVAFVTLCAAQNLVLNGNFETYHHCPTGITEIDSAAFWTNPALYPPGGSPEYFNACSTNPKVGVPINAWGHQKARSGEGYSGLVLYTEETDFREYIEGKLANPLVKNECYQFEMYYNQSNNGMYSSNTFGVYFSQKLISGITNANPLPYQPQLSKASGSFISDTLNWILFSGNYTAKGGETYLIIGNFKPDSKTSFKISNKSGSERDSYIYIDDVSLTPIKCSPSIKDSSFYFELTINPNPVTDKLIIRSNYTDPLEIILFDVLGRKILSQSFTGSTDINTIFLSPAIYLYEVRNNNTIVKEGKVFKY